MNVTAHPPLFLSSRGDVMLESKVRALGDRMGFPPLFTIRKPRPRKNSALSKAIPEFCDKLTCVYHILFYKILSRSLSLCPCYQPC